MRGLRWYDGQAALDLAGDRAGNQFAGFQRLFELQPGSQTLCTVTRQHGVAVAVFQRVDSHGHEVAFSNFELALVVQEFFQRDQRFGLQTCVHNDEVVVDTNHFGGNDFAGLHLLLLDAFFEHRGKAFFACELIFGNR